MQDNYAINELLNAKEDRQMELHGSMKVTVLFQCQKMCAAEFMKRQEWISQEQSVLMPDSVILMRTPLKYSEKDG